MKSKKFSLRRQLSGSKSATAAAPGTLYAILMTTSRFITFISLTLLFGCGQSANSDNKKVDSSSRKSAKTDRNKIIETITTDLNNDNIIDTIILTDPPVDGDPGEFQKISFIVSTIGKSSFSSNEVWDKLDKDFVSKNKNNIKSSRLFLFKNSKQTIILLFGFQFGTGREFSLIQIKDNKIKLLYNDKFDNPVRLADNNGDIEFIGKKSNEEYYQTIDSINADIGTYSPFLVYNIDNDLKLNEQQTKKYNEDNYVYAGQKYSDKIKVLYPRNGGQPKILK